MPLTQPSRFIIKPDSNDLGLILAAAQYRKMWKEHGVKILRAFRTVTGMDIVRTRISARVTRAYVSAAGNGTPYNAMRLAAGDYRSNEFKLMTMVHELTHRLLMSNGYGPHALKFTGEYDEEIDHRHVYLIEYDVVLEALGKDWADICVQYESRGDWSPEESGHIAAWQWAMNMTSEERAAKRMQLFRSHRPHNQGVTVKKNSAVIRDMHSPDFGTVVE